MSRSLVKDLLVLFLSYKVFVLAIAGAMPLSVVVATMGLLLISAWFRLEKLGVL